jgi:hypothetical protein
MAGSFIRFYVPAWGAFGRRAVTVWLFVFSAETAKAREVIGNVEPGNPLLVKPMPVGNKAIWIVESADMKLDDLPVPCAGVTFPS